MASDSGTWREFVVAKLVAWGPIDKDVFILRLTPMMPPGYAWRRWIVDSKLRLKVPEDQEMPEPSLEDFEKAQRALVLWFLRQLRREGKLIEDGDTISFGGRPA
jgi:hypothetical protein